MIRYILTGGEDEAIGKEREETRRARSLHKSRPLFALNGTKIKGYSEALLDKLSDGSDF